MPINPFDQFDAPASRSGNPFDQFDGPALATPPKLTRSLGEKVKDTAIGIGQGTMQLGGALATLPDVLTGGAISEGVVKPFQRLADKALGGTGEDPAGLAGGLQTVQQMGDEQKSPVLRRKQQDLAATEGFLPSAAKVLTDPTLLWQFAAEQAPILATLGAGTAGTAAKAASAARMPSRDFTNCG